MGEGMFLGALFAGVSLLAGAQGVPATRAALFEGTVALRPEVVGVHPRLFVTPAELEETARRYRRDPALFAAWVPAPESRLPEPVALDAGENGAGAGRTMMRLASLWRVTGDPKYLRALDAWIPAMQAFTPLRVERIGGSGNRDLTAGGLLYGFAAAYDLVKGKADARIEDALRGVLVAQGRQLYADLSAVPSYPYEQNHLTIPTCGLALAAMALCDEMDEAKAWLVFTHNVLDRCLNAVAYDGWFFESISYWNYTMQYPLVYASALRRTTGEDLFKGQFFGKTALYLAHTFLPGSHYVFDFADWGPRTNSDGKTAQRGYERPWHTLETGLAMYVPLHHETSDPLLKAVIEKVVAEGGRGLPSDDRSFATLWGAALPERPAAPGALAAPPFHYFPDMDVIHWRENWTDPNAAALAFRSGPPAGHHLAKLLPLYAEWRPSLGHAHPDAGSFILFSRGVFLANDTGYAVKESRWHNTLTVDGAGQGKGASAWSTWSGMPYDTLDRIRLANVWLGSDVAASTAVFEDAYLPDLKLRKMRRHLIFVAGRFLVLADEIESDVPHTYDWFLHTDREPQPAGAGRWTMENGPARLVVQSLGPALDSARIEPTVVETELYFKDVTRPQQRGFHLNLRSPGAPSFSFLTAMAIQPAEAPASGFTAREVAPNQVEMADGSVSCRVWIGPQEGLDGTFGFVLRDGGRVTAVGLSGKRLDCEAGRLEVAGGGQVVLRRDGAGGWAAECSPEVRWSIR